MQDSLNPFDNVTSWQYIKFDDDYAIGVSYNSSNAPLVSAAILAKEPCFNVNKYHVSGDRKYVYKLDQATYIN